MVSTSRELLREDVERWYEIYLKPQLVTVLKVSKMISVIPDNT